MRQPHWKMLQAIHAPRVKPGTLLPDDPVVNFCRSQLQAAYDRYVAAYDHYQQLGVSTAAESYRLTVNYRYRMYEEAKQRMDTILTLTM